MHRSIPFRHWYPSMVMDEAYIDTRSMGKVFVGFEMKRRIDSAKSKLRRSLL
jgi:hypothetical protein